MKRKTRKQFELQAYRQRQAKAFELMPWDQVRDRFNESNGESISTTRVQQIAAVAEQRIREAVLDMAEQFFRD